MSAAIYRRGRAGRSSTREHRLNGDLPGGSPIRGHRRKRNCRGKFGRECNEKQMRMLDAAAHRVRGPHGSRDPGRTGNWRFLDLRQAAKRLSTSERAVEALAGIGQLRGRKWNDQWRFLECDVDELLVNRSIQQHLHGKVDRVQLPLQFADPWHLRTKGGKSAQCLAGSDGRPVPLRIIRIGGTLHYVADIPDLLLPKPTAPRRRNALSELRRARSKRLALYRNSGLYTEEELRLIEGRLYGKSLAILGQEHGGVSRQAIWERLEHLNARTRAAGLPGWTASRTRRRKKA